MTALASPRSKNGFPINRVEGMCEGDSVFAPPCSPPSRMLPQARSNSYTRRLSGCNLLHQSSPSRTVRTAVCSALLRYPAISSDGRRIAFGFEGHLFIVPSAGGIAQSLTTGPAHDTRPVWSPDGKLIAYASDRYGHYNVFLISVEGGPDRRLTSYSTDEIPSGFTPDGKYVLFSAHRMQSAKSSQLPMGALIPEVIPTLSLPEFYK